MRDELQEHYEIDYSKTKRNRFADRMKDRIAVLLDPDVASVFTTAAEVNTMLRSVIRALPENRKAAAPKRRQRR